MSRKSNTEEFVKKAQTVHGDKYDYSETNYVDAWSPVTIICKNTAHLRCRPTIIYEARDAHYVETKEKAHIVKFHLKISSGGQKRSMATNMITPLLI